MYYNIERHHINRAVVLIIFTIINTYTFPKHLRVRIPSFTYIYLQCINLQSKHVRIF